ncbi:MAG: hypothetical protein HZB17_13660 [Chloroflexi bacterium]|nr:hypothetical protein [Chloroflexota bacterium]
MDIVDYGELLARGIRAVRAGKNEEGKKYLAFAVRAQPRQPQGWLWLAAACEDPSQQKDCLMRVINLDANNLPARILLSRFETPHDTVTPSFAVEANTQARAFICPQCGGRQRFDPEEQSLTCLNCGTAENLSQTRLAADDEKRLSSALLKPDAGHWALVEGSIKCENCGAITTVSPTEKTLRCPFCDSPKIITQAATPGLASPNAIAPFTFEMKETRQRIKEWLNSKFFIPDDLNQLGRAKELRAIYIPFWTFDGKVELDYDAEVPHEVPDPTRKGGTRTEWAWEKFFFDHRVDDLLVPASSTLTEKDFEKIAPFELKELKEYRPEFLADWQAEIYQVSLADAAVEARKRIHDNAIHGARRQASIRGHRGFNLAQVKVHEPTYKHILLPLWIGAYTYRGKLFRVFVNGQTGKVGGETPTDWLKVALVVVGALVVVLIVIALIVFFARR